MKRKLSRLLSALLVVCMIFSSTVTTAFAASGTASLSSTTMTESGSIEVTFSQTATSSKYYNVQIADSSWSTTYVNTNITSGNSYTISGYSAGTYQIYIGYWENGSWKSDALSTTTFTVTEDDATSYELSLSVSDSAPALGDSVTVTASFTVDGTAQDTIPDGCTLSIWYGYDNDGWSTPVNASSSTTSTTISVSSSNFTEGTTYTVKAELYDSSWNVLASGSVTFTPVSSSSGGDTEDEDTYAVSITPSATTCEQNGSITFTATVTYGDEEITLSEQSDVYLWIWADSWADGHSSGLTDCSISPNTGLANSVTITFPSVGTYYIAYTLTDAASDGNELLKSTDVATITVTESTADASEEISTGSLSCDFMRGMDLSTFYTNWTNGAVYYDYDGNEYSQSKGNAVAFFQFLYDECGVNWVRLRVWNDPYDEDGNPYGGGNNDVATAAIIGKWASDAGMTLLIDFHYSDFWADPGRQLAPKAWTDMTIDEKSEALYTYTYESLQTLLDAGVNVGMVQVGNETNGSFCGESISTWSNYDTNEDWQNMVTLFKSGSSAVRAISKEYDTNIKVSLHFTNPNNNNPSWYCGLLVDAGVDFDAIGISYYMYWHGTLSNLANEINTINNTYGKEAFIAETAYPYTSENYDNLGNQITSFDDFDMNANLYAISEAGQEAALTGILNTLSSTDCTGLFYWEAAWTTINSDSYRDAGGGWATKWASDYISYSMSASEGSSFDNQALFDNNGNALPALKYYVDFVEGTENLPEHNYVLDEDASTAATCGEDGVNVYVCSECGDTYTEAVAATSEHTWDDGEVTTEATCTEDGVTTYTCTVCGETKTESIEATGHTTEIQNAKDATCTEDGYTGDEVCTVCGETVTAGEVIPATGHTTEIQNAKDATCTEDGYTGDEVCTVCGETVTAGEVIPATGHTADEAVVENEVAATCTEDGSYDSVVYCSVCNEEISRETVTISATGHTWNDGEVTTEATCTEDGVMTYTCTVCGESKTEAIEATGHDMHTTVVAPTCTENGYTHVYCSKCDYSYDTNETAALGHTWDAGVMTKEPTTEEDGEMTYTCTVCGETKTESIDKLEPEFAIIVHPEDATAYVGGSVTFSVTATGTGLTYQWQYQTANGTKWYNCTDTTSDSKSTSSITVSARAIRDGYKYRCVVTDAYGNTLTSDSATLSVITAMIVVTAQPENVSVEKGTTATFSVAATSTLNEELTYQWQYKTASGSSWYNCTSATGTGYTTSEVSLTANVGRNGYQYRCKITDESGNVTYSDAATLTVTTTVAITITAQPEDVTVEKGSTATFSVEATGNGLTYQWQYMTATGTKWYNCTSATGEGYDTSSVTLTANTGRNGYQYRCKITDADGNVVYSDVVTLTVTTG